MHELIVPPRVGMLSRLLSRNPAHECFNVVFHLRFWFLNVIGLMGCDCFMEGSEHSSMHVEFGIGHNMYWQCKSMERCLFERTRVGRGLVYVVLGY